MIQSLPAANITLVIQYISTLPDEVMKFNVFAIVVFLILLYIAIYFIQKLTTFLVFVLKKVFLFLIVTLAFYQFVIVFVAKLETDGLIPDTILFGVAGTIIGFFAFVVALYVAFHSIKKIEKPVSIFRQPGLPEGQKGDFAVPPVQPEEPGPVPGEAQPPKPDKSTDISSLPSSAVEIREKIQERPGEKKELREELSLGAIRQDKGIGIVIAYIVIAEFGVFSSKTIAAPTVQAGLLFFVGFMLASIAFVRLTYSDYWKGLRHLGTALVIGGILSLILGFFWGNIPLDQLLSLRYFATDSLVALVTALALSLFMGGGR
jgi:hypothetical protein